MNKEKKRCLEQINGFRFRGYLVMLVNSHTLSNNWHGLLKRLEICHHELYDYFLALALLSVKKEQYWLEYIDLVQKSNRIDHFIPLMKIADMLFYTDKDYANTNKAKVMSIYIDKNLYDTLYHDVLPYINKDKDAIDYRLFDYIQTKNKLPLDFISELYHSDLSHRIITKVINYYWYLNQDNDYMIDLFSYICIHYPIAYMENIYNQKLYDFNSKKMYLIEKMFVEMIHHFNKEYIPFGLFIIQKCMYLKEEDINLFMSYKDEVATSLKHSLIDNYTNVDAFSLEALDLFNNDEKVLQDIETSLYEQKIKDEIALYDDTKIITLMHQCYDKGYYYMVHMIYHDYSSLFTNDMIIICESMIHVHQYNQAIAFINEHMLDDQYIIKTLADNFEYYGISVQAYDIFNDQLSMDQAINMLVNCCRSNFDAPYILMAIYHKLDYLCLNYLYLFYSKRSGSRYTLLLKMIRRTYSALKDNVYNIIEEAVYSYDVDELKDYFAWCKVIKPLKSSTTKDYHIIATQLLKLMNNYDSINEWQLCLNKIEQIVTIRNTSLAYTLKAMYLIKFEEHQDNYYQTYINQLRPIYDKNHNFIKLNTKLITFMNDHYLNQLLETLTNNPNIFQQTSSNDIQSFYDALIQKYLETYNMTILQIINNVTYYSNNINLYLPIYQDMIKTNQDKSAIIQFLFELYPLHQYQKEINIILSDTWTCNHIENKALDLLRIIYSDQTEIFGLSEFLSQRFRNDITHILRHYPDINPYIIKIKENNDYPLYYQLTIFKETLNIIYDHTLYKTLEVTLSSLEQDHNSLEYHKNYITGIDTNLTITYQQCYYNGSFGTFYIIRKYKKMLILKILQNTCSFDDAQQDVLHIMESNGHYGLVYESYKVFKDMLYTLLHSHIDKELLRLYLICLYDDQFDLLYTYPYDIHLPLETYYNLSPIAYNQNLLSVYEKADDKDQALAFINLFNSDMAKAISALMQVKPLDDRNILSIISSSKREFIVVMDDMILNVYQDHIDDIITLIVALKHPSVLLRAIDKNTRKNIPIDNLISHKLLLKLDKENYYHYYNAIQNAYIQNFESCIIHYFKIMNDEEIKHDFSQEFTLLTKYIQSSGQTSFKYIGQLTDNNEISEKEIRDIDFLKDPNIKRSNLKEAQEAFKNFYETNQSQQKLDAGSIAIHYMRGHQDFYRLCGNIKTTYNEFIFEYGLLYASSYNTHLSIDDKLSVLLKLYSYYDHLNDLFKVKIKEELHHLFMSYISYSPQKKEFISIQSWMNHYDQIKNIVEEKIIETFIKDIPVSLVDRYHYDQHFYNTTNFNSSPILQDFEQSLKHEIHHLSYHTLLEIDHVYPMIEDDKLFFEVNNIGGEAVDLLDKDIKIKMIFDSESLLKDFNQYQEYSSFHTYKHYNTLLKPGNRIGEYIDIPYKIVQLLNNHDQIQIIISIVIDDIEICRDSHTYTYINHKSYTYNRCRYNVSDCAWSQGNQGFGRQEEIKNLQYAMNQNGITMIYGSSRIGKSSLLTYLKETYSKIYYQDHKLDSFTVISLCDATNLTYYQDLHYDSDEEIIEFLFIDSIYKGLSESDRHDSYGKAININEFFDDVYHQKRIVTKIQKINDYLLDHHAIIWVLMDEFQQLIDKWHIADDKVDNWKEVSNYLKTISNIKFVLCGSDAIVKAIKNTHDNWHKIIIDYDNQPIMQLSHQGFVDMIQDQQVWHNQPCPFTTSSIDYLFNYVGGNATYGKLLANMMIDVLEKRDHIFSYDVFKAGSMMLENQSMDLDHMQSTQTMISQVTKNLDDEERYLQYIAKTLEMNPNRIGVSKEEIDHDFANTKQNHPEDIDMALEVCIVRGILKLVDDKYYSFTTPFYYYCYSHSAKHMDLDDIREHVVEVEEHDDVEDAFDVMLSQFDKLSYDHQLTYLSSLTAKADKEVKDKLLEDKGHTFIINAQDSTNMTINANTFNAILTGISGDDLIKAYQAIPQFSHFVSQEQLNQIEYSIKNNTNDLDELLEEPLNQVYQANKQALILTEDDFNVWDALDMSKQSYDELISTIDQQFMTDIYLAAKLENIYDKIDIDLMKDYSPITIMYCKVVEKMLKYYHTPIYIDALPNIDTTYRKSNHKPYKFGELKDKDTYNKVKNKLMLGTFITPIHSSNNIEKLSTYPNDIDMDEDELKYTWNAHAKSLDDIREVRNASAHGENDHVVGIDALNKLKKILFKQKRLIKIVQLFKYYQ